MALHKNAEIAHGSIRFSFGRENDIKDVDKLVESLKNCINILRSISPLT